MKYFAVSFSLLLLSGCILTTKDDVQKLVEIFFKAGYDCHKYFPDRSLDQCWAKYQDIVK